MKKIVRLTESDLIRLVKRVIKEDYEPKLTIKLISGNGTNLETGEPLIQNKIIVIRGDLNKPFVKLMKGSTIEWRNIDTEGSKKLTTNSDYSYNLNDLNKFSTIARTPLPNIDAQTAYEKNYKKGVYYAPGVVPR